MNGGRLRQLVMQDDAHAIAFPDADLGARHLAVVRHRGHRLSGRDFPSHLGCRQLEDLDAGVHARRHSLASQAFGLRRERLDPLFVHRVHFIGLGRGRHWRRGCGDMRLTRRVRRGLGIGDRVVPAAGRQPTNSGRTDG